MSNTYCFSFNSRIISSDISSISPRSHTREYKVYIARVSLHTINVSLRIFPVIPLVTISVPDFLYRNLITAYLGFPGPGFYSTDYFSLLPWSFLYLCGYELHMILKSVGFLDAPFMRKGPEPLAFLGRHSLLIYLLHQPVLYALMMLYGFAAQ